MLRVRKLDGGSRLAMTVNIFVRFGYVHRSRAINSDKITPVQTKIQLDYELCHFLGPRHLEHTIVPYGKFLT